MKITVSEKEEEKAEVESILNLAINVYLKVLVF